MAKNERNIPQKPGALVTGKWWTKKKIIAASVVGVVVIAAIIFAAVMMFNRIAPIESTDEEARVVGTVGGFEVRYEELRYITLLHKASLDAELGKYDSLDESGKAEYEEKLNERVMADIENNYVILSLCEKYGIKTDSYAARKYVDDSIKNVVKTDFDGSVEKYKDWLEENNITDSVLRLLFKVEFLEGELLDYVDENGMGIEYDEQSLPQFIEYVMDSEDWIRTVHIFYPRKLTNTDWYSEEYLASYNGLAMAQTARDNVVSSSWKDEERVDPMYSEIGRAPMIQGISTTGNGSYFTWGQMGDEYESAAFALDEYGVSEVVEAEDGYFVIMRLQKEESDVKAQVEILLSYYRYAVLKEQMDAEEELLSFEGNEYFGSFELVDVK